MIVFATSVLFLVIKATSSLDVFETLEKEINAQPRCIPNMVYKSGDVICKCDQNGYWPNVECTWTFKIANSTGKYCEPDSYVMVSGCKICRCNDQGRIDNNICTDNCPVSRKGKRRSGQKLDSVYGSCVPKNWYSLAPCQFCYCIAANKLVCNTGNRKYDTQLELGSYNLTICGKYFVKEAIELVPTDQRSFLREGDLKNKNVSPPSVVQYKPVTPKTKATPIVNPELQIQVNRESSEKNEKDNEKDDKVEYYSDSEEKKAPEQGKAREGFSTQQPYEEADDERNSFESNEVEGDDDRKEEETVVEDDKEEEIIIQSQSAPADKENALRQLINKNLLSMGAKSGLKKQQQDSKLLKINIPSVLDKLFKMALRKSMVKLDTNTKCEPGTTEKKNCNVCFCLTNGKMLCTDKTC